MSANKQLAGAQYVTVAVMEEFVRAHGWKEDTTATYPQRWQCPKTKAWYTIQSAYELLKSLEREKRAGK